jgi:hypothetical protein
MDYARIIAEAKAERSRLVAQIEKLDALISFATDLFGDTPTPMLRAARTSVPQRTSSIMGPTREAVAKILRKHERPMVTAELVPLVLAEGVEVGGKNAVATLSARLSNGEEFTNNRGIGWWFTGEAVPRLSGSIFDEAEGQSGQGEPSASIFD